MKKSVKFMAIAMAAVVSVSFASCGGSKAAPKIEDASFNNEKTIEKTRSQQLAENKPAVRAWGEGTHLNQSFAKGYAENMARAEFSRKLATVVQTAIRQSTNGAQTFSSDGKKSSSGEDQGILSDQFAQSVSDAEINNVIIINTDTYQLKDRQYHCFVCIEWIGDTQDLVAALTRSLENQVNQQVSDKERAKMEVRYDEFRKSVQDQLDRLKKVSVE